MWPSTSSVENVSRPRVAVALVSAIAAISAGYYVYRSSSLVSLADLPDGTLHRSNAVRRNRSSRRPDAASNGPSEDAADENAQTAQAPPRDSAVDAEQQTVQDEEWWNDPNQLPAQRAGHNIVSLLFRVSEDNARRNGCVHRGCQCNACGMVPIRGIRYRCANCADFDLCEACETQGAHIKTHIFYKIRIPVPPFGHRQMQPVWYTGDPESCRRAVPKGIMSKLSRDTGFERPELEAFWEQWTFMANTEWRDDPDQFCIAMDRKTFERCLVPTGASAYAQPNLIHDRMFSFYDSNNDNLIGFSEFLHGLSYRRRKSKLQTVFNGYDIDNDGYVNRRDFLRMFKAYYVLYKQMHRDILDGLQDQMLSSTEAQQLVSARQPISSYFGREERVPLGDPSMRFDGKVYRSDGHVDVDKDKRDVFVENESDTATRKDILTSLFACETDRRVRRELVTGADGESVFVRRRRISNPHLDNYWLAILEPPSTLSQLSDVLLGNSGSAADNIAHRDWTDQDYGHDEEEHRRLSETPILIRPPTESETRARAIERSRRQDTKLDKKRREMARRKLYDRWRRRHFYLDEEEGGDAPDDWETGNDILVEAEIARQREKRRRERRQNGFSVTDTSDSESDDFPYQPMEDNPTYRHGAAEDDAGKEILYQVTQQAFNELLDVIFKPVEDIALQAAETRLERAAYADLVDQVDLSESEGSDANDKSLSSSDQVPKTKPTEELNLYELIGDKSYLMEPEKFNEEAEEDGVYRDPTMPQNRPNIVDVASDTSKKVGSTESNEQEQKQKQIKRDEPPSKKTLKLWKRLNAAEEQAEVRGGWGKLNFEEFEKIYITQENLGNQLGYLGSWIDFCIP